MAVVDPSERTAAAAYTNTAATSPARSPRCSPASPCAAPSAHPSYRRHPQELVRPVQPASKVVTRPASGSPVPFPSKIVPASRRLSVFDDRWSHHHAGRDRTRAALPRHQASSEDGAFMEASGRNQWQRVENATASEPAQIDERPCRGCGRLPRKRHGPSGASPKLLQLGACEPPSVACTGT